MTKDSAKRIRFIYGIILSTMIAIAGLCFIICSLHIYLTGDQTYTPEKVASYFSMIAIPVYLCLALIIGGFVLDWFLTSEKKKGYKDIPPHMELERVRSRASIDELDSDEQLLITNERRLRSTLRLITCILLAIGFGLFLVYALNIDNFPMGEFNSAVLQGVLWMAACLLLPFSFAVFTVYRCRKSMKAEIELLKKAPKTSQSPAPQTRNKIPQIILQCSLTLAAITLLVLGIMGRGAIEVLAKAVNICMECIGLG